MKKLLILSIFISFFSFMPQEPSNLTNGKFERPKFHYINKTSCFCDYNDKYIPNKEIDVLNFVDGEKLLPYSNNKKILIHNRKDILLTESLLWERDLKDIQLLKQARKYLWFDLLKTERELKRIYKSNKQKELSSDLSSFWILKLLNPDLYSTDKNKIIELRKEYKKNLSKYKEQEILNECLLTKNYDKTYILKKEFYSSLFWDFNLKKIMDNYYRTRLTFSEAISYNELGFYLLRRIISIFGYLPYALVVAIILYKLIKRKKTKTE